jgi:hypothetical protein
LGLSGTERADVRVWLAQGGDVDIEVAAVNAHLLMVGAVVAVAFVGRGWTTGLPWAPSTVLRRRPLLGMGMTGCGW